MTISILLTLLACKGDETPVPATEPPPEPVEVRFATYNTSLNRSAAGVLVDDLADPAHEQARLLASVLQELRPDVVLLAEVDWDADGEALRLLRTNFLAIGQDGREPLDYPYAYAPSTNTGEASGIDLDGNGQTATTPGSQAYGNDAFGYGEFPGQYGFAVLSRFPIAVDGIRTFRTTLWRDVPDNSIPPGFFSDEVLDVFRLSSKSHADVPIRIGSSTVHFLVSHPTPPSFDGPEDKNGRRNSDEIAFWEGYLDAGADSWHVDDAGVSGGLNGASFVIAGDLNADPADGDTDGNAIGALLAHPRVNDTQPTSAGGTEQAAAQGQANARHSGDPALDTADFADSVGNLRVDYVLPSVDLEVRGSGVFWPESTDPLFPLIGTFPFPISDHRPVWVDLTVP